jgi:hypothetical protein
MPELKGNLSPIPRFTDSMLSYAGRNFTNVISGVTSSNAAITGIPTFTSFGVQPVILVVTCGPLLARQWQLHTAHPLQMNDGLELGQWYTSKPFLFLTLSPTLDPAPSIPDTLPVDKTPGRHTCGNVEFVIRVASPHPKTAGRPESVAATASYIAPYTPLLFL